MLLLIFSNQGPATNSVRPLSYYSPGLVSSQYRFSTNFLTWLTANLQLYQDDIACGAAFPQAFAVQSASGAQLDILGSIIGQSRTVAFQPSNGVSPVLIDDVYRLLLQARIFQNHWSGKFVDLFGIRNAVFPGGFLAITDHQDMTLTFYVAIPGSSIIQDLVVNGYIFPRPQAVQYIFNIANPPLFGFDVNNAFAAGFDQGHFA